MRRPSGDLRTHRVVRDLKAPGTVSKQHDGKLGAVFCNMKRIPWFRFCFDRCSFYVHFVGLNFWLRRDRNFISFRGRSVVVLLTDTYELKAIYHIIYFVMFDFCFDFYFISRTFRPFTTYQTCYNVFNVCIFFFFLFYAHSSLCI